MQNRQNSIDTNPDRTYDKKENYSEGYAVVSKNKKFGYIDESGKEVIPLMYDYRVEFKEGYGAVWNDKRYGFFNKTGKITIPLKYESSGFWFKNGYVRMKLNGKWGFIDMKDNKIVAFIYDDASAFFEGRAAVAINGKWGYVDTTGKLQVLLKYSSVNNFNNGFAYVGLNEHWGIINTKGEEVIPPIYDDISDYSQNKLKAILNGKSFIFDITCKEVRQ